MSFDKDFINAVAGDITDNITTFNSKLNENIIPKNAKKWVDKAIKELKPDHLKNQDICKDSECWDDVRDMYKSYKLDPPEPFKNMKNKEINLELLLFTIISIIVFFTILKNITNK